MKIIQKYNIKKKFLVIYICLILVCVSLTIGRWVSVFNNEFIMINEIFHYSVSNLTLSCIFYLSLGYYFLIYGKKFSWIIIYGLLIIFANLISETMMGFINTTDIWDFVFGITGTLIAFIFLTLLYRFGLIEKNSLNKISKTLVKN